MKKLITICENCNSNTLEINIESGHINYCQNYEDVVDTKLVTLKEYNDLNF